MNRIAGRAGITLLLALLLVAGFAFFVLGEGIEKREDNLADEVAKMLK